MPVFSSTEKMYEVLGTLFRNLMEEREVHEKFQKAGITIKFDISSPKGEIWLADSVICGPCDKKPTVQMFMDGDTCHAFWLKEISMPAALAKGKIRAKGPIPKILKLLPLVKNAYDIYPELAKSHGILNEKTA